MEQIDMVNCLLRLENIMYAHETYSGGDAIKVVHYRMQLLPSGLAAMTEIAQSGALVLPRPGTSLARIMLDAINFELPTVPSGHVECNSVKEFAVKGVATWLQLLEPYRDRSIGIGFGLTEKRKPVEEVRPSGLVVVPETPETCFDGYVASPDEITAIETIQHNIQAAYDLPDRDVPGNYL